MSSRALTIVLGFAVCIVFLGAALTKNYNFLGVLVGFLTGLFYIQWLYRDVAKSIDKDIKAALRSYRVSLLSRLGMVTMVAAIICRFKPAWIYYFIPGIIAGVLLSLVIVIREKQNAKGGE